MNMLKWFSSIFNLKALSISKQIKINRSDEIEEVKQLLISPISKPSFKKRYRKLKPKGLMLHTSGVTIARRANMLNVPVDELALKHYRKMGRIHLYVPPNGILYQMLPFDKRGPHAGVSRKHSKLYKTGAWEKLVNKESLRNWKERYMLFTDPNALVQGKSPNDLFIGMEFSPLLTPINGDYYSDKQYDVYARVYLFLEQLFNWDENLFPTRVGHECVNPMTRWFQLKTGKKMRAWDPGALRDKPKFSWMKAELLIQKYRKERI